MCGEPARDESRRHVEQEREPRPFPVADGERTPRLFDGARVARESPFGVEAAVDGKLLAALAVCGERAVGELRHRHVQNDVTRGARRGDDERVVAEQRSRRAPRRKVRHRVRPAERERARVGRLPAVAPAAHPVVRVPQRDAAQPVPSRKLDCPRHRVVRVQIPRPAPSVPTLKRPAVPFDAGRARARVHRAFADHLNESRKTFEAVRVDAVAVCVGEEARAKVCAPLLEADFEQGAPECLLKLFVADSHTEKVSGRQTAVSS